MNESEKDVAGAVAPPPFIFAGTLVAGLSLDRAIKLPFLPIGVSRLIGTKAIIDGLVVGAWGFMTMKAAETELSPYKPTRVLVESGPFAYTRNPLYLSITLVYAGIATLRRAPLTLALLPLLLSAVQRGVIEREERYLEQKFGDSYRSYRSRVGRWLPGL
jgi:protein-S-isoprenylcysteine O-methyltransferase Ste14